MPSNIDSVDRNQAPAGKSGNDISVKPPETAPGSASLPSLSLPNGGGAIRGIGEKFAANPVTGTGSLTVPVYTSPGRSGFGPQLSLAYDSGSGNGPLDFGWSLLSAGRSPCRRLPAKTDKGLPRYEDALFTVIYATASASPTAHLGEDAKALLGAGRGTISIFRILSEFLPNLRRTFAVVAPYTALVADTTVCTIRRLT